LKRGEVWSAATGGGFGGKPRPVIVVQGALFGETPHVIVALCQTARNLADDVRPRISPDRSNGLQEISDVAVDLLVTVPRRKFGLQIGQLSDADMHRVDRALLVFLGFAHS